MGADLDLASAFERARGRFRFASSAEERRYRAWHTGRVAPLVGAGMLIALVGGFVIVTVGSLTGSGFGATFRPTVFLVSPGFILAIAVARVRRLHGWLPIVTAAAITVWGTAIVWSTHRVLDAPELGTTAVLIVALFGLVGFRLSPVVGAPAILAFAALHQVLINAGAFERSDDGVLHSVITWIVVAGAMVVAFVVDREERTRYEHERIIARQGEMIDQERRRADDLLRNILPNSIADRLMESPDVIADHHTGVTVLFADIVGFTPLSARLPAPQVVSLLDDVFRRLDDLVDGYGVEKIKTVGDSYMAVAGAPEPRADHVDAIANLALDINEMLASASTMLPYPIEMRIGVATGDAIGGVIGRRKFAYDLWSDTVNMAARMESHGIPGRIQLTEETAHALAGRFEVTERGPVEIKGKGLCTTWFLEGRTASVLQESVPELEGRAGRASGDRSKKALAKVADIEPEDVDRL